MRDILSKLEKIENLQEGKYGAHGKDLDSAIDSAIEKLGDSPSLDEIYAEVAKIRQNEDIGGMFATKGYREAAALGAIAKALGLPGLYKGGGNSRTFVSTEQDDANRFEQSGGTSKKNAKMLAQKGFLTKEKAEKLGLEVKPSQSDIDAQGAAAADAGMNNKSANNKDDVDAQGSAAATATSDSNTLKLASGQSYTIDKRDELQKEVFDNMLKRYIELVGKMNESAPISLRGYLKEYSVILVEALSDSEKQELEYLYKELNAVKDFKFNAGTENEVPALSSANQRMIQAQLDRVDPTLLSVTSADTTDATPTQTDAKLDKDSQDSGTSPEEEEPEEKEPTREPSGSLDAFSKAGQGGLANNPEEIDAIKELQTELKALGFDPKGIDGKYGPGTIAAVKAFQKDKGLTVDGDAGPNTIAAILRAEPEAKADATPPKGSGEDLLNQIQSLLDKANIKPAGVTSTVDSPIAASMNFNSLIGQGIFESVNLREALSSEEQMKLQSLLNKLKKDYPDLANQNQKMFTQAQKIIKTGKLDAPAPKPRGGRGSGRSELELRKQAKPNAKASGVPTGSSGEPTKSAGKATPKQQGTTTKTSSTKTTSVSGGGSTTKTRQPDGKVATTRTPGQNTTTTTNVQGTIKMGKPGLPGKPSGPIKYNGKTVNPGDPEYAKASAALMKMKKKMGPASSSSGPKPTNPGRGKVNISKGPIERDF